MVSPESRDREGAFDERSESFSVFLIELDIKTLADAKQFALLIERLLTRAAPSMDLGEYSFRFTDPVSFAKQFALLIERLLTRAAPSMDLGEYSFSFHRSRVISTGAKCSGEISRSLHVASSDALVEMTVWSRQRAATVRERSTNGVSQSSRRVGGLARAVSPSSHRQGAFTYVVSSFN